MGTNIFTFTYQQRCLGWKNLYQLADRYNVRLQRFQGPPRWPEAEGGGMRVKIPCTACDGEMDSRSRVCHSCAVAVQKATFTIPKRRQPVIMPYRHYHKPGKKFRSM